MKVGLTEDVVFVVVMEVDVAEKEDGDPLLESEVVIL